MTRRIRDAFTGRLRVVIAVAVVAAAVTMIRKGRAGASAGRRPGRSWGGSRRSESRTPGPAGRATGHGRALSARRLGAGPGVSVVTREREPQHDGGIARRHRRICGAAKMTVPDGPESSRRRRRGTGTARDSRDSESATRPRLKADAVPEGGPVDLSLPREKIPFGSSCEEEMIGGELEGGRTLRSRPFPGLTAMAVTVAADGGKGGSAGKGQGGRHTTEGTDGSYGYTLSAVCRPLNGQRGRRGWL
jgi:hypothetical protein